MPLIRVELFDYRLNEETSAKLIAGMTDALCACLLYTSDAADE